MVGNGVIKFEEIACKHTLQKLCQLEFAEIYYVEDVGGETNRLYDYKDSRSFIKLRFGLCLVRSPLM